ncbi:MAG: hypothetical protein HYW51_02100 [Candidatus Doudnabacteria bacterium]|nr:hypothetical protein [Candidatus Doudnabacteria bacterium]
MARVTFDTIFASHTEDNSYEPRQRIRVGSVEFGPGVRFTRGVAFGGVEFDQVIGHELEVETQGDLLVIKGVY